MDGRGVSYLLRRISRPLLLFRPIFGQILRQNATSMEARDQAASCNAWRRQWTRSILTW